MCGIAGYLNFVGSPASDDVLRRMAARIAHRGPDGCGTLVCGPAGIAHRRLSIIDVEAGAQCETGDNIREEDDALSADAADE